jgi:hypothetical protein
VMRRPKTMFDPHGVVHYVYFLDAVYWRPPCMISPFKKPKGWTKHPDDAVVTCLTCIGDMGAWT